MGRFSWTWPAPWGELDAGSCRFRAHPHAGEGRSLEELPSTGVHHWLCVWIRQGRLRIPLALPLGWAAFCCGGALEGSAATCCFGGTVARPLLGSRRIRHVVLFGSPEFPGGPFEACVHQSSFGPRRGPPPLHQRHKMLLGPHTWKRFATAGTQQHEDAWCPARPGGVTPERMRSAPR